ncbi:kinesin-like protein KIF2A isoform X2 [Asterias rubens]|uniref:kinesin-like protein KIF2A isoform X2 n=1 Tax=Asterias rubens TaxID=7604 RepID=UPI001454F0FC|nr:kinesin-like protein KIF2A isoform X2 [Asterias rubens]
MDASTLDVGMNVDIQRSDGRVHSACISGISKATDSVTVEWFERGETKGKEVEISQVYALNPELSPEMVQDVPLAHTKPPAPVSSIKARPSSARMPLANVQQQQAAKPAREQNRVSSARAGRPNALHAAENGNANHSPAPAGPVQNAQKQSAAAAAAANRRRSNVVKEVDKIKKNREVRRAKQAEQVMQRINEGDGNHPQWEFIRMIREYQEDLDFRPITNNDCVDDHQITVCVRKRPLNKKENSKRDVDVVTIPSKDMTVIHEPKLKVDLTKYLENQVFRFDYSFDEHASNELVYKFTAKKLVETIFSKGFATCFAYGQTGSGKTHTMGGNFNGKNQDVTKGIYALAATDVFKLYHKAENRKKDLVVSCSFFEIYSGKVFDLLNKKAKLRVLEDGKQVVQVVGLEEKSVNSVDDVLRLITVGNNVRTSGQTSANNHSSRSHAVFQIILRTKKANRLYGKFSLIDLAGNERGKDTQSSNRQTRMEGAEINKSLLALKECIRSLSHKGAHVPFRASKLTQVLRDSFIGDNTKTCMIAMISPGMSSCEHTLNTLRYADRVKELGPGGPNDSPGGGDYPADLNLPPSPEKLPECLSPSNSDLAMLCTHNEEEVSAEMFTFHEVMNQLQEMEEQVVDDHRVCLEETQQLAAEEVRLIQMTDEVDYDVEDYVAKLGDILTKKIDMMVALRDKVNNFHGQLQAEETASKNMRPPGP